MKSVHAVLFMLFLAMLSANSVAQSFKIDSIIKGADFNEYSKRSQNYFEELIEITKEFTITIREGELAIVSMEKSGRKLLLRFFRTANMLKMSKEDYLTTNEFYSTSDIINGINYLEMFVERVFGEISSGEIGFYPEEGLYKPIFTVVFSRINKINTHVNQSTNNALSTNDNDSKQRLVFVDIDHVPNFDYESLNEFKNDLSDSEIKFYETENNAYIEITMKDGNVVKWEFYRILGDGKKTDEFITFENDSIIPKKMFVKRDDLSNDIKSLQIGYYDEKNMKDGGAFMIIYLSVPKNKVKANNENGYQEIGDASIDNHKLNNYIEDAKKIMTEIEMYEQGLAEGEKADQNSLVSGKRFVHVINYSLKGRTALTMEKAVCISDKSGVIVVKIDVDKNGTVIKAEPGVKGTTIFNELCWRSAEKAALKAKFNIVESAPVIQEGTISFNFVSE